MDSSRLKLARAKHHLDSLGESVLDFFDKKPYSITLSGHERGVICHVHLTKPLPQEWGLIVGDIAGNLRASLDYIVFQLSLPCLQKSTTKPRDWNTPQFPICDSSKAYNSDTTQRCLAFVPRDRLPLIEKLQPYHGKDWQDLQLLAILRDISNGDKHRLLTPAFSQVVINFGDKALPGSSFRFSQRADGFVTVITNKVRAQIGDVLKPELVSRVSLDVTRIRRDIIASEPFAITILRDVHNFIRDEVLPTFADCLPA